MSRRTARGPLIALAALSLLVLIALPPALGTGAQRAYEELLRGTLNSLPAGWTLVEHYERGWFQSHATAELTQQPATGPGTTAAAPTRIHLDSRIDQGPWSWFSAGAFPVAARVQTRVDWLDGPLPLPPLFIDTTIGINGSGLAQLLVPATDQSPDQPRTQDGYRLHNEALTGTVRMHTRPPQAVLDIALPGLALGTAAGELATVTDARLKGDLIDWNGGVVRGHLDLTIAAARLNAAPGTGTADRDTLLERLNLTLEAVPKGQAQTRRVDLRLKAAADRLQLDGIAYRSPELGLSARSLDTKTVADLTAGLRTLASTAATPAMRGLVGATLLAQLLPRFMTTGPSIELNPFSLTTPEGPVSGHLSLAVTGQHGAANGTAAALGALLGGGPAMWLGALSAEGELALPRPIAAAWLARADATGRTSPADQLQAWIDGGWVTARDGRVTSAVRLAAGRLSINGKRVPLRWPAFGG